MRAEKSTATPRTDVVTTYRRRARRYDITANLYYLLGFREWAYRRRAVAAIGLRRGDTVVEVGCGTGLNFELLQRAIGPHGRIIGVDVTDAMLDEARHRVRRAGWMNVELVHADAADYRFPEGVAGVLSTFALSLSSRASHIIAAGSSALLPGRSWVVLDLKTPPAPLDRAVPVLLPLVRPFGVTDARLAARPWEQIWGAMFQSLDEVHIDEAFWGTVYLARGTRYPDLGP